ncbi:hypothetical protein FHS21_006215 [Phyllobacterium trifolii]|uniref:Uncharacterized protein n=1 Tax=Phyllobacterium trifolii TaxID=300193 RepID=A0A839UME4_9HYPH|nr:hypothetical protein [Phyllobacterium trifolii]
MGTLPRTLIKWEILSGYLWGHYTPCMAISCTCCTHETVADAYGRGDDWRAGWLGDDEILALLFLLNQERSKLSGPAAVESSSLRLRSPMRQLLRLVVSRRPTPQFQAEAWTDHDLVRSNPKPNAQTPALQTGPAVGSKEAATLDGTETIPTTSIAHLHQI